MGVLSNGRKISAQFFPRTLIEMPYNKTFGCIIVQKSDQTTFIQLMTLKLVSKNYLEVTCDFHPFPIELTAWGKKITAVIKSRVWRWRVKWMVTFSQPVNSPLRHGTKRWEVASIIRSGKDKRGLIRLLNLNWVACSQENLFPGSLFFPTPRDVKRSLEWS